MEPWLTKIRDIALADSTPRVALMGGTAVLALVVVVDLFGARDRAPEVRETLRMVAEDTSDVTVPSRYSVPRDLASEMRLARMAADAPVADDDAPEEDMIAELAEEPEPESEVEMAAEPEAEAEVEMAAEPEAEAEVEMAAEPEAEAEVEMAAEPEAEAEVEMAAEPEAEAEVEMAAEAEPEAEVEMAAEPEAEAEAELAESEAEVAEDMSVADAGSEGMDDPSMALLAGGDGANGQRVWRQCGACHVYDAEQNRGGPHLVNIVGREIGSAEGWRYSRALSEHGGVWTVEGLLAWLENPDAYIPGNQMAFRGLRNEQDRIDLLTFLIEQETD